MRNFLISGILVFTVFTTWSFGQTKSVCFSMIPSGTQKLIAKGQKQIEKKKYDSARKSFEKAIKGYRWAYQAHAYLGIVSSIQQDHVEAIKNFEESLKVFESYQRQLIQAREDQIRELDIDARNRKTSLNRHDYITDHYDTPSYGSTADKGLGAFESSIPKTDNTNPAVLAQKQKSKEAQIEYYKQELEKDKQKTYPAFFRFKYGNALFALHQQTKAREQYSQAVNDDPDFKESYANLAVCLYLEGKIEKALECYDQGKKRGTVFNKKFENDLLQHRKK